METLRNERLELHTAEWMIENHATPEDWQNWRAEKLSDWLGSVSPLIAMTPADRHLRPVCRLGVSQHRPQTTTQKQTTRRMGLADDDKPDLWKTRNTPVRPLPIGCSVVGERPRGTATKTPRVKTNNEPHRDPMADWLDQDGTAKSEDAEGNELPGMTLAHVRNALRCRLREPHRDEDGLCEALAWYCAERSRGTRIAIAIKRASWLTNNGRRCRLKPQLTEQDAKLSELRIMYEPKTAKRADEDRKRSKAELKAMEDDIRHVFAHFALRSNAPNVFQLAKIALPAEEYADKPGLISAREYREAQFSEADIEAVFKGAFHEAEFMDLRGTAKTKTAKRKTAQCR
jgi:hypothetical protein